MDQVSDQDLSAFAALHDMLNDHGLTWRLTSVAGEAYRIEVKWPASFELPNGKEIDAEAATLRALVTELGAAMVGARFRRSSSA